MPDAVVAVVREPSELRNVSAPLKAAGIEVTGVSSLLEVALHQFESPANVIVCDADEVNWRTALGTLRELPGEADVIFLIKHADDRLWVEMLDAGVCDVLQKPFCGDELCWVVCTALRRRAMRRPPDRATSTLPCPPPNAGKRAVAGDGLS
jgi:DNA-binding response OmpR family regulator